MPKSQFHGGFGLVAFNLIKKPVFHTFEFFSKAGNELLYRDDNLIVTKKDSRYVIIGWNWHSRWNEAQPLDRSYRLVLPSVGEQAILIKKVVGGDHANPLQTWSNLGKPRSLTKEQVEILTASAQPLQTSANLTAENGEYHVQLDIPSNHVCMVEIIPIQDHTDTYAGFDPDFYGMR